MWDDNTMKETISTEAIKLYLKMNNDIKIPVSGFSMEPLLNKGDKVLIEKSDDYNLGDIIVYVYGKGLLVHRIIEFRDKYIVAKGDNSYSAEIIEKKDIIGIVRKFERYNCEIVLEKIKLVDTIVGLSRLVHIYWLKNDKNIILAHRNWRKVKLNQALRLYIKSTCKEKQHN